VFAPEVYCMTAAENEIAEPQIRVDADACPIAVRCSIEQMARKYRIGLVYYIDDSHELDPFYGQVRQVGQGRDSVDLALINQTRPGDIVVTQDYGLAALVLARRAIPIHPGGMLYTEQNIDSLLADRHMAARARKAGERFRNPRKRQHADDHNFSAQLQQQIIHMLAPKQTAD